MRVSHHNRWIGAAVLLAGVLLAAILPAGIPAVAQTASGGICVAAFADENSDGLQDPDEVSLLPDVVFHLANAEGVVLATYRTDGQNEPHCFAGLSAGEYAITFNSARYLPTQAAAFNVSITEGQTQPVTQRFGAAIRPPSASGTTPPEFLEDPTVVRLAVSGIGAGLVVLVMLVLGAVIFRVRFGRG